MEIVRWPLDGSDPGSTDKFLEAGTCRMVVKVRRAGVKDPLSREGIVGG